MKNRISFLVAFAVLFVFPVCLISCSEKEDDRQEQTVYVINVDVAGGSLSLKPFTDWSATVADADNHMRKTYGGCQVENEGQMEYDSINRLYFKAYTIVDSVYSMFYFEDSIGKKYIGNQFCCYASNDIEEVKNNLLRQGFIFMGYTDYTEHGDDGMGFNWCYGSRDKKTMCQVTDWADYDAWGLFFSRYFEEQTDYVSRIDIY